MSSTLLRRHVKRCDRCRGKLAFATRGDAQRFIRRQAADHEDFDPVGLAAYRCPFGLGFHFGHSRDGQSFADWRMSP